MTGSLAISALAFAGAGSGSSTASTPAPVAYYDYSGKFSGKTPFHETVSALLAARVATTDANQDIELANLRTLGFKTTTRPYQNTPIYPGLPGQMTFTAAQTGCCTKYDKARYPNLEGAVVHFPADAVVEANSDKHIGSSDPSGSMGAGEYGMWEANGGSACANTCGPLFTGNWGAFYAFSGSGLSIDLPAKLRGSKYNAGGFAYGLLAISPYDLQAAHYGTPIAHALGLQLGCITATDGVYPSNAYWSGKTTGCTLPTLTYGALLHLKPAFDVAASGASEYCAYILDALQTRGAYVFEQDAVGLGASIAVMSPVVQDVLGQPNYWTTVVEPSMIAQGDATGSPDVYPRLSFHFSSCLNRAPFSASNWEVLHLTTTTDGLP